jgi:hypothetical protein
MAKDSKPMSVPEKPPGGVPPRPAQGVVRQNNPNAGRLRKSGGSGRPAKVHRSSNRQS